MSEFCTGIIIALAIFLVAVWHFSLPVVQLDVATHECRAASKEGKPIPCDEVSGRYRTVWVPPAVSAGP